MSGHKNRRKVDTPPASIIDLSKFKITTEVENVAATRNIIRNTIERFDKSNSKKDSK